MKINKALNTEFVTELNNLLDNPGCDFHIRYLREDYLFKTLDKRCTETNFIKPEDYLTFLKNNSKEQIFLQSMLNNTWSEFFRHPFTYSLLESVVLPSLLKKAQMQKRREIRVWSAACAGGHEPYSLAILLNELQELTSPDFTFRIFATDCNQSQIDNAKKGVFPSEALDNVSLKRLKKWFIRTGNHYRVQPVLQQNIDFSQFNLFDPDHCCPPASIFGDFDILFCSNVLFYYNVYAQSIMFHKLTRSMASGGFFMTGEAERSILRNHHFKELLPHSCIFIPIKTVKAGKQWLINDGSD